MERGFRKVGFDFRDEFIREFFAAGVTETRFTGIRNKAAFPGVFWALIDMVAQFFWVTAGEHFVYGINDILWEVLMFGEVIGPMAFEDLFNSISHRGILWR